MERNVVVSRRRKTETSAAKIEGFDVLPADSEEAHVLAVDDSLVDRKVIERLLKISSFKGDQKFWTSHSFFSFSFLFLFLVVYILIFQPCENVQWLLWIVEEEPCNFLVWTKRKPLLLVLMWEWIIFSNNSVFISCMFEFLNFCLALFYFLGLEGGSDYHRLLHAWNDWLRIAQENQGQKISHNSSDSIFCLIYIEV